MGFHDERDEPYEAVEPLGTSPPGSAPKSPTPAACLTPKQLTAIGHLLEGKTREETAKLVEVNRKTLFRWFDENAGFQEEYRRRSHRLLAFSAGRVRASTQEATKTLIAALKSKSVNARVKAAGKLWDIALQVESDELSAKFDGEESQESK